MDIDAEPRVSPDATPDREPNSPDPGRQAAVNGAAAPLGLGVGEAASGAPELPADIAGEAATGAVGLPGDSAEETAADAPVEPTTPTSVLRYWVRPLLLSAVALTLLALTWWDQRRVADTPVQPDVLTATPPGGSTVTGSETGLIDALGRLGTALQRRDARALANLADPGGVIVAGYGGGLPDAGYTVGDAPRLAQDVLPGAQISLLRWRLDGRGRVIVLSDGWQRKPVRVSGSSVLELTPLTAIGLTPRGSTWYWHWLLPDDSGALAQQARTVVWQPWPA